MRLFKIIKDFLRSPKLTADIPKAVVKAENGQLSVTAPNGDTQKFIMSDLTQVTIRTLPIGPFADDMIYELAFGDDHIILPSESIGMKEFVDDVLLNLPGIDNMAFIDAMGSTNLAAFVCYEKA